MSLQHIIVDGRDLGTREVPNFKRTYEGPRPTGSLAYFCCRCGEVWARLATEGAGYTQVWQRYCARHGDGRLFDGPWRDAPEFGLDNWPKEALRYELERSIEFAERQEK